MSPSEAIRIPAATPRFVLLTETAPSSSSENGGCWRFVLQSLHGAEPVEVIEDEPGVRGERLELLAVVRGLEALEQPAHVTLVTSSRYVRRGLLFGLPEWRQTEWQWERFGEMVPVKNDDLWRRLDRALQYHDVVFRVLRIDPSHETSPSRQRTNRHILRSKRRAIRPGGKSQNEQVAHT